MTANQINYQNLMEQRRSNLAKEAETNRSNVVKEVETQRHNEVEEYNNLIGKLNNPFSLISHGAEGSSDAVQGLSNILDNLGLGDGKFRLPNVGGKQIQIPLPSIFAISNNK